MGQPMTAASIQAVFLDMDDTILDFGSNTEATWSIVCEEVAARRRDVIASSLQERIAERRRAFWREPTRAAAGRQNLRAASRLIVDEALFDCGISVGGLAQEISERFRDLRDEKIALYPHTLELLDFLRASGLRLAMLTNGSSGEQRAKIERFDLARHFEHIHIEGEHPFGKPHPEVFLGAFRALDCGPDTAWMVGDNLDADIAGARSVGMTAVWIDHQGNGLPVDASAQPHHIVPHSGHVRGLIEPLLRP
jgi:putative hydrolase of the HAD superfamily